MTKVKTTITEALAEANNGKLIDAQFVDDLFERKLSILTAIKRANAGSSIELFGVSRTIEEWLLWKQYIVPARKAYLTNLIRRIDEERAHAQKTGGSVIEKTSTEWSPNVIVNLDEIALRNELMQLQEVLDTLDGKLSLMNATIAITV